MSRQQGAEFGVHSEGVKPPVLRCAHLSDLHFSKPTWELSQFFSKRWLGNANLFMARSREYVPDHLPALVEVLTEQGVQHVLITGDLSCTSSEDEFRVARDFVAALEAQGFTVAVLPGNHDHYTRSAYRNKLFYKYFQKNYVDKEHPLSPFSLKEEGVAAVQLSSEWCLLLLDTALATSLVSSCGKFSRALEEHLARALSLVPAGQKVLMANHFPLFCNDSPRKRLLGAERLRALLEKSPQVRLYLHGHSHRHCIADLRNSGLPIILDSGSTASQKRGSWNLLTLSEEGCTVQPYFLHNRHMWVPELPHAFTW